MLELKLKKRTTNQFQPGNNANPKGRGSAIPIKKELRKYTTTLIAEIYNSLQEKTRRELRDITINPNAPALEVIVAKSLLRDLRRSDNHYSEIILNRIIGPVVQKQELTGANGSPISMTPPSVVINPVKFVVEGGVAPIQPVPTAEPVAPTPEPAC